MPFFLLPRMEGPLVPFGSTNGRDGGKDTGYDGMRDRGANAAVNRMGAFPQVTKRWWSEEFAVLGPKQRAEAAAETERAFRMSKARGDTAAARL
eukprot:COSAG05_NODE_1765_length_4122_cov_2.666915_2_plen_94_part_00